MHLGFQERAIITLAVLVFVGVGLFYTHMGLTRAQEGWASHSWPTSTGIVTSTNVAKVTSTSSSGPGKSSTSTSYFASVNTRYQVNDVEYTTRQIALGENQYFFKFSANWAISSYEQGDEVTIYYNPEDPEQAVLDPGLTFELVVPLLVGFGIVIAILFFGKVMLFSKNSSKPRKKGSSRLPG